VTHNFKLILNGNRPKVEEEEEQVEAEDQTEFLIVVSYLLLVVFRNKLIFYGEELLAPRPTPKLEDHPLSAVRDCLFNIFAATLQNWREVGWDGVDGLIWLRIGTSGGLL
jgi:hypothetical protein